MGVRSAFLVLFVLGGLIWWPFFLLAALSAYSLIADLTEEKKPEPDEWFARRQTTTAADPRWRSDFLQFCESPAEVAFLNALIDGYKLEPQNGLLQGGGITLDLQVKVPPYRADFIANGWLVIEIDGAAWHSSADAVDRDRQRDQFMDGLGYRVLRIPAKLVFDTPLNAVSMVRDAIASGRPSSQRASLPEKDRSTGSNAINRFSDRLEKLNDNIQVLRAIQNAMAGPELAFHSEKVSVESAFASARRQIELEKHLGSDPDRRRRYEEHRDRLTAAIAARPQVTHPSATPEAPPLAIPVWSEPSSQNDTALDEEISKAFRKLQWQRTKYFIAKGGELNSSVELRRLVKAEFRTLNRPELWRRMDPFDLSD